MNQELFTACYYKHEGIARFFNLKDPKTHKPRVPTWQELVVMFDYRDDYGNLADSEVLRSAFRRALKNDRFEIPELDPDAPVKKSFSASTKDFSVSGNTDNYVELKQDGSMSSKRVISVAEKLNDLKPDDMVTYHGLDPAKWELTSCKMWEMPSVDEGVRYLSSIAVKPRVAPVLDKNAIKNIIDEIFKEHKAPRREAKKENKPKSNMLIVGIADLHYGLKAEKETSNNKYDENIARSIFNYIIEDVAKKASGREIDSIVLWNGGDFHNSDNLNGTTTAGTKQDNAIQYYKMISDASKMMIEAIETLAEIAPVEYITSLANHDNQTIYALSLILEAYFRNDKRVKINTTSLGRQYMTYGNSLIGFAHEFDSKKAHKTMSEEASEWSDCPFRYFLLAHLHHESVLSDGSVEIRRLSTPSAVSEWAYKEGYVGTVRKNQSFLFDHDYGLIEVWNTPILSADFE